MKYFEDIERKVARCVDSFRNHKATLLRHGFWEVLDWRMPDTGLYAVRIVFDPGPNAAYITGDLGEAIIRPTCKATLASMASCFTSRDEKGCVKVNVGYFMEKFATASDRYGWCKEDFVEDFKDRCEEYELTPPENFLDDIDNYFSPVEFFDDQPPVVAEEARCELEEMDADYPEWFYDCGKRVSARVIGWLVAIRLASEHIERVEREGK